MTPASLVNGEANFEWRPAEKATTQLITHVTSETAKKYTVKSSTRQQRRRRRHYYILCHQLFWRQKEKKEPLFTRNNTVTVP